MAAERGGARAGVLTAITTYALWGCLPAYWKLLEAVPSIDVLCSRVVWSFCLMAPLILLIGPWRRVFLADVSALLRDPATILKTVLAAILVTANWFGFIFAVTHGMIMESSLGYFINPLLNVVLAIVFLKERLGKPGIFAVLMALAGVAVITVQAGVAPWISLFLAFTFALYGLLKKGSRMMPYTTLTIETLIAFPFAAAYMFGFSSAPLPGQPPAIIALLVFAGVVTAVPLLLFNYAATRISYIALGFTQYLSPTLSFLMAVLVYREPLPPMKLCGFALIWAGIAVYCADAARSARQNRTL